MPSQWTNQGANIFTTFLNRFADGLKEYLNETQQLHYALNINKKVYPGYKGYGIHQGSKNKTKRLRNSKENQLQRLEKEKPDNLRVDAPTLDGIVLYIENITAVRVFNVEILRQSPTGQFGSKEFLE